METSSQPRVRIRPRFEILLGWMSAILLLAMAPGRVAAQTLDAAVAETLYQQGRQLMREGNYPAACAKFQQSQRLDPAGGTLINLANCLEKSGRTASAWAAYKQSLTLAERDGREDRVAFVRQRLTALEGNLSHVTLRVADGQVTGFTLRLDGTELGRAVWNSAMPVDPGLHVVTASAPSKQRVEQQFRVEPDADHQTVEIPVLGEAIAVTASPVDTKSPGPMQPAAAAEESRALAYALGAGGILALGVGSYFGLRAVSEWERRNRLCDPNCTPAAVEASDNARRAGNVATATIAVGVVALAAGTYLLLRELRANGEQLARSPNAAPLWFDARLSGAEARVTMRGSF